ncbi:16S rRNA (cytosine(967)-C(5))-methyltransferase RsmB [bacterium]|nr:16S rRNA (cytosine(967)-C(5))-methyltransferase RsmB [bacterium]
MKQTAHYITSPRHLAVHILNRHTREKRYIDWLIDDEFKQHTFTTRDRAFVLEIVQGTIRWQKKLAYILGQFTQNRYSSNPVPIRSILSSSLYQILYMTRTPGYATINEAVNLSKKLKGQVWANRVNGILRNIQRQLSELPLPDIKKDPVSAIAVLYSHPEWMIKKWLPRYGVESTCDLCAANNQRPGLTIRVNQILTSPAALTTELAKLDISAEKAKYLPDFLRLNHAPALGKMKLFQDGLFSVQDESAGLAATLLAPEAGDTIVDFCAAPGGKTGYLAEKTADRARIIAADLARPRIKLVQENIERLKLTNVLPIQADAFFLEVKGINKILLDVPCSGLGVLAKRADLRWERTPEELLKLQKLQSTLLERAAELLPVNGVLVYSTCTIEPAENEEIIRSFLQKHPDFQLENPADFVPSSVVSDGKFIQTWPHIHGIDGSFAARLKKVK